MIYIILFFLSFILAYFIKNYALKKSLVSKINERSSHSITTPHGGGLAIAITWFIGLLYLYFTNNIDQNLFYALLLGVLVVIVGFFDDLYELNAKFRLLFQALVSILALYFLGGFENLTLGLMDIENQFFTNIFAFFMIIWFINLYNFLDGINGYAGSEGIFLCVAGFLFFNNNLFLILAVSILGFLYWNYNKAKIFMGDVGSTLLGYNVAIFTIYYANADPRNFWIWIILFSLFWFDATFTLLRRKLNNEKLAQAHKKHAYQRLTQANWSHFKVTNCSILVNIILFLIVYLVSNIFLAFLLSLILLFSVNKFVDSKKPFSKD